MTGPQACGPFLLSLPQRPLFPTLQSRKQGVLGRHSSSSGFSAAQSRSKAVLLEDTAGVPQSLTDHQPWFAHFTLGARASVPGAPR